MCGDTNRIGCKNMFSSVRIWFSNISTSVKLSCIETNQTSLLCHVDFSRWSKNFYNMTAPWLDQAQETTYVGIILKTRIIGLRSVFAYDSFSLELQSQISTLTFRLSPSKFSSAKIRKRSRTPNFCNSVKHTWRSFNPKDVSWRTLIGNKLCLNIFCERKFRQRRSKCVSGNQA